MSIYSKIFADNYDALMGSYSSRFVVLDTLIHQAFPERKNLRILELACGSGNNLLHFPSSYDLFGLDIAPAMVKIAKKKVPHAKIVVGDMTNFSFDEKFDLILCLYDSINHLTTFRQWQKVFYLAHKHLKKNGVFIFDMNTIKRLQRLSLNQPAVQRLDKDTLTYKKIHRKNDNEVRLHVLLFQNIHSKNISVTEQYVDESSFEVKEVQTALQKYFIIEQRIDPLRLRVTKNSMRLYFVCRKRFF